MQSVFSIKDAISKKESREISAMFGVTVTQVLITTHVYSLQFCDGMTYITYFLLCINFNESVYFGFRFVTSSLVNVQE